MFCRAVDIEGCDAWKAELWSNAPFWDGRAPALLQTGRESTETLLPVLFKIVHWWLEVGANFRHKSKDIAPRKRPQTWPVQRGYIKFLNLPLNETHLNPAAGILPHGSINFQAGHSQELFHIFFNLFRIATWQKTAEVKGASITKMFIKDNFSGVLCLSSSPRMKILKGKMEIVQGKKLGCGRSALSYAIVWCKYFLALSSPFRAPSASSALVKNKQALGVLFRK